MYFEEITKANYFQDFSGSSDGKESACNVGDRVQSLGGEDSLEKGMATHSNILAGRITRTEEPGGLQLTKSFQLDFTFSLDSTVY